MRLLIAFVLTFLTAAPALASPRLVVGVTEDGLKFEPAATRRDATAVGLDAVRITLTWRPGERAPDAEQAGQLDNATNGAGPLRVVLSVFGDKARSAPKTASARNDYCEFLRNIVARYDRIRDVVVWNEPNKAFFWQPQFDAQGRSAAPRAYEALLARCWDVLHRERDDVNVLAPSTAPRGNDSPDAVSNVSHSPVHFIEELGRAYRASGRDRPIFDTVSHHVHGLTPAERPWRAHAGRTVAEGDYERLVDTLARAFRGTAQPVPGHCVSGRCAPIWYLEAGFQTRPAADKAKLYSGKEVGIVGIPAAAGPVDLDPLPPPDSPAPDQATQLASALRLAYCQPYVEAFFNFLLWDERSLEGWQSGLYWIDRTEKPSVPVFRRTLAAVRAGRVDCLRLRHEVPDPVAALGPKARAPGSRTTSTTTTPTSTRPPPATTTVAAGRSPGGGEGGSDGKLIAGVAALLAVAGGLVLAVLRRANRFRRNSR